MCPSVTLATEVGKSHDARTIRRRLHGRATFRIHHDVFEGKASRPFLNMAQIMHTVRHDQAGLDVGGPRELFRNDTSPLVVTRRFFNRELSHGDDGQNDQMDGDDDCLFNDMEINIIQR